MADASMPNPFRKDAPPRTAPPSVGGRDFMRLYVMGVVLILVVGTMIWMQKQTLPGEGKEGEESKEGVEFQVQDGSAQGTDPEAGQDGPDAPKERKTIDVAPLPPGEVSFKELAAPFRDGVEKPVKETPEFITLLSAFLKSVKPEDVSGKIVDGLTANAAYLEPEANRGVPMKVFGRLIMIYTERIDATTPDNIEVVYLGVMQEYMTDRTVLFYLPEYPVDENGERVEFDHYIKRGQRFYTEWIQVEGIFLRQFDYPSQVTTEKGEVWAKSALLMAKTMRTATAPENLGDPRGPFLFVVLGLGVVLAIVVLVVGIISRKHSAGSLRMRMREVKKTKGEETLPKPNPEKQILGDELPKPSPDAPKFEDLGDRSSEEKPS